MLMIYFALHLMSLHQSESTKLHLHRLSVEGQRGAKGQAG